MSDVKPKKHLGQHFLKNDEICHRIASAITFDSHAELILEVGPGTGALTKHLINLGKELEVVEVDTESIDYLNEHFEALHGHILNTDFLKLNLASFGKPLVLAGNFPYNISSQILFHALDFKDIVPEVVGMFQKEVALRIASPPGSKQYGILSVLLQAYYTIEYLFTVDENEFIPPPKVKSGVIRLRRNTRDELGIEFKLFKRVVKMAFNQRRKTLRNSMKQMINEKGIDTSGAIFNQRPEQLSVEEFIQLCKLLQ